MVCSRRRDDNEASPIDDDALGTGLNCLFGRRVGLCLVYSNSAAGADRRRFSFGRNRDGSTCHSIITAILIGLPVVDVKINVA